MEEIKQCLRNSDGYYCLPREIKINLLALEDILNCRAINYLPNHTRSHCKSKCYGRKYKWNDWMNVVTWEWGNLTYGSYCFPLFKGLMYHVLTLVQLFFLPCPLVHSCREGLVVKWQKASEHRVEYSDPAETMHRRANFRTKQNSNFARQLQVINTSHKLYCDVFILFTIKYVTHVLYMSDLMQKSVPFLRIHWTLWVNIRVIQMRVKWIGAYSGSTFHCLLIRLISLKQNSRKSITV